MYGSLRQNIFFLPAIVCFFLSPRATAEELIFSGAAQFANIQGQDGWYYLDSQNQELQYDTINNRWHGKTDIYLLLYSGGGHAGNRSDAVRRWVAPVGGTLQILGRAFDTDLTCGDGVVVSIAKRQNSKVQQILWSRRITNGDVLGGDFDLRDISIRLGEAIDFIINRGPQNNWCDWTYFDAEIRLSAPQTGPLPPVTPIPPIILEAYQASEDFSSSQGASQWYYLNSDSSFMRYDADQSLWIGNEPYLSISKIGSHPGLKGDAIRRWIAPQKSVLAISGSAFDSHAGCGDGVAVSIKKDGNIIWAETIDDGDTIGKSFSLNEISVETGTKIDFVVNKRGRNDWCDSTGFDPLITLKRDLPFSPPVPPPPTQPPPPEVPIKFEMKKLAFTVGPAIEVISTLSVKSNDVIDSFFSVIELSGKLYGYTANSRTRLLTGSSIETLSVQPNIVIDSPSGTVDRETDQFDGCGAWLQGLDKMDDQFVRGWYHGEKKCNYHVVQTYKSIAYAESRAEIVGPTMVGKQFTKPGYPNNLVISSPENYEVNDVRGHGDHDVIRWGDFYYLFFINTDLDLDGQRRWWTSVARSKISEGGKPGTWWKYLNGKWDSPGVGGRASKLGLFGSAVSRYVPANRLMLLLSNQFVKGVTVYFSGEANPLNWEPLADPLMYVETDWYRPSETELVGYVSAVPPRGGKDWTNEFWLFYLYIEPGRGIGERILVRRRVTVAGNAVSHEPQVGVALSHYTKSQHTRATTALAPGYSHEKVIGYIYNVDYPNSIPLLECYIPEWDDYLVSPTCNGTQRVRQMGWISKYSKPGYKPIWRCFNSKTKDHLVSDREDCGSGEHDYQREWLIGYIAERVGD